MLTLRQNPLFGAPPASRDRHLKARRSAGMRSQLWPAAITERDPGWSGVLRDHRIFAHMRSGGLSATRAQLGRSAAWGTSLGCLGSTPDRKLVTSPVRRFGLPQPDPRAVRARLASQATPLICAPCPPG